MNKILVVTLSIFFAFITSCKNDSGKNDPGKNHSFTANETGNDAQNMTITLNPAGNSKNVNGNAQSITISTNAHGSADQDQIFTAYVSGVASYPDAVALATARGMIRNYARLPLPTSGTPNPMPAIPSVGTGTVIASNSYSLPAYELLSYINNIKGNGGNISRIHFILGLDNSLSTPTLNLFVAAVNPTPDANGFVGDHYYISDDPTFYTGTSSIPVDSPAKYYVLKCQQSYAVNIYPLLHAADYPTATFVRNHGLSPYDENIEVKEAAGRIMQYNNETVQSPQPKIKTAMGFSINANVLTNYLRYIMQVDSTLTPAKIVFFLGEESNRLTLVIAGLESDNQTFIYMLEPGVNYPHSSNPELFLLEHVMPCPTCLDIANFGEGLELPIQQSSPSATPSTQLSTQGTVVHPIGNVN